MSRDESTNDELRDQRDAQESERQERRDEAFEGVGRGADEGSQDERRHEEDRRH